MEAKGILTLLGAFAMLFCRGVFSGFVVDDVARVKVMSEYRKKFKWTWKLVHGYLQEGFYGAGLFADSRIDHGFNLLIHFANSILIYSIVQGSVGFWAAMLYMANPVNNQVSLWLNGRRYLVTILLVLLSWKFKLLGILLFPAAAYLHVSGILFPLLYLTTPMWWAVLVGVAIAGICGLKRVKGVWSGRVSEFVAPEGQVNECQRIHPKKLILYVKSVGWYAFHILFPFKPRMYHEFLYYFSRYPGAMKQGYSLNAQFWFGLATLGGLAFEILSRGAGALWAVWFLLFISQWSNIYTVTMHAADRYCSLAGIGLMVLLAEKILLIPATSVQLAVFTSLMSVYVMRYQDLFKAYKSYGDFLRYHIWIEPTGVEARYVMALDYLNSPKPNPMSAYAVLRDGLRANPHDFKLLLLMAQTMFAIGQIESGLKLLDRAEAVIPLGDEEDCKKEFAKHRAHFAGQMKRESLHRKHFASHQSLGGR